MTEKPKEPVTSDARKKRVGDAFATFVAVLRRERVPNDMDVPDAFSGLNDDEKRVLFLLHRRSAMRNAQQTATRPDALSKARAVPEEDSPTRAQAAQAPGAPPSEKGPTGRLGPTAPEDARNTTDPVRLEKPVDLAGEDAQTTGMPGSGASSGRSTNSPAQDTIGADAAGPSAQGDVPVPDSPDQNTQERDRSHEAGQAEQPPGKAPIADVPGMGRSFPVRPMEIRLPNARVRQVYSAASDRPVLGIVDDGGTGLSVDPDGGLVGTPERAGDFTLSLEIADPDGSPRPATARLTVIADPRDLWVNHPSDRTDPYWKEDGVVLTRSSAEAFLLAGSLRGRSHAQKGGFREDDVALRLNAAGWHILVVADGAGSAKLSREASRIAVETAADAIDERCGTHLGGRLDGRLSSWSVNPREEMASIRRDLLYPVLAGAALKATNALVEASRDSEASFREYSTTLLIAIARPTVHGWMIASFSVGDGGIVAFDADAGNLDLLCAPDSGEYAGQTNFLTPDLFEDPQSVMDRIHCVIRPSFTALAVMSDGVTDPFFPTDAALADPATWRAFWFDELTANVTLQGDNAGIEGQMIDWLGFWSKGNHDDRTIAVLVPDVQA